MERDQQIRTLQLTYAAQLADAVTQYGRAGILEQVTEERRSQRLATGAAQAAQLGIAGVADAFTVSAELFGCADWAVGDERDESTTVVANQCLLSAMVRKTGGPSPCRLFCLDPIEGMVRGLEPDARLDVEETLYEGEQCRVRIVGRI